MTYGGYPMVRARLPRAMAGQASPSAARDITAIGSLNWAGYAVWGQRKTFTSIRATFFVPYAHCTESAGGTLSSHWVGFDGFMPHSQSVEQAGIAADCSARGKAIYYAWFEMFPKPETRTSLSIRPGDSITVVVTYSPSRSMFRLSLTDNTRGERLAVQRKCPDVRIGGRKLQCLRNSAEAISEAPATGASGHLVIAQLTDYGAVSFDAISIVDAAGAAGGPVSARWQTAKITQLRSPTGAVLALPTPTQAATFDIYWSGS